MRKSMSRERELLAGALGALERWNIDVELRDFDVELIADIRAELEKPEPVESLVAEIKQGDFVPFDNLPPGKYKLIVVRIDDE
jgi:hypothetical protein